MSKRKRDRHRQKLVKRALVTSAKDKAAQKLNELPAPTPQMLADIRTHVQSGMDLIDAISKVYGLSDESSRGNAR